MILYFRFLIALAGNDPTVAFPRWTVRDLNSLGPQHRLHNEHQQLQYQQIEKKYIDFSLEFTQRMNYQIEILILKEYLLSTLVYYSSYFQFRRYP